MNTPKKRIESAANDAKSIAESCPVVRLLFSCEGLARRVCERLHLEIEEHFRLGWNVSDPDLAGQALSSEAQEIAADTIPIAEMKHGILQTLLPVLDILEQQNRTQ